MKISLPIALAALIFLLGCSGPPIGPTARAGPVEPDGITPKLKRSTSSTLYNLEKINSVVEPATRASVSVAATDDVTITGWAVDQAIPRGASGARVAGTRVTPAYPGVRRCSWRQPGGLGPAHNASRDR